MTALTTPIPVTVAMGDGIGPEIMTQTLRMLEAAGAALVPEFIEVGEAQYLAGHSSGIGPEAWDSLRRTGILLKAPITTPLGGGYKSLNVTLRKTLGLYANVRPTRSLAPAITTKHPVLDVVIVRENEEDLYAGIEHQHTPDVVQCLKIITRSGCERIVRYAFEYARTNGRRRITCMTKDNIMKLTDGLFHKVFVEVGREYPDIVQEHQIIDIGAARLADTPERYDVVLTLNLYGDIISDIVAQIAGSVGLAGSSNIGQGGALFEAIHGSAPDIAGQDVANPSGLLQGAILLLRHIGQPAPADRLEAAWLRTLEDGLHTADIFRAGHSTQKVGTRAFADAVIARLGQQPAYLGRPAETAEAAAKAAPKAAEAAATPPAARPEPSQVLVGIDVFLRWWDGRPDALGHRLEALTGAGLCLKLITNRGVKVYPDGHPETTCTDHWRCRFVAAANPADTFLPVDFAALLALQTTLTEAGLQVVKTENLYLFDGVRGFSLGQGE